MGIFQDSISIFRSSWNILWKDKEMLLFPILSAIGIIGVFVLLAVSTHSLWLFPDGVEVLRSNPLYYGFKPYLVWFLLIFLVHLIINIFNAAIVASSIRRLRGENPTITSDMLDVLKHWKQIFGWVFIVSVFIFIVKLFKNKGWIQSLIGDVIVLGASIASFFVVPIIMIENDGPINAIKKSSQLLWNCWGNQVVGRAGMYLVISLLQIPAIVFIIFAFDFTDPNRIQIIRFSFLGIAGVYIAVILAVSNALTEIFRTVLYLYALDGKVVEGFTIESLQQAFKPA